MINLVNKKIAEVQKKLEDMGYKPLHIDASVKRLRAGCSGLAYPFYNRIEISSDYFKEFPVQIINRTVVHEVVHLYIGKYFPYAKQSHGPEFRNMMRRLGADCSTNHSMKLSSITAPVKKLKTVQRFIYETAISKKLLKLTATQHNKIQARPTAFTSRGEKLVFTNKVEKYNNGVLV